MKVKKAGTHGKHGAARMRAMGKMADMPAEKPAHTPGGRLTAEGRKLYPRILEALVQVFNRLLHGFSRSEVRQLQQLLKRMVANA